MSTSPNRVRLGLWDSGGGGERRPGRLAAGRGDPFETAALDSPSSLRTVCGPTATELHILCRPEPDCPDALDAQTESVYRRLHGVLSLAGGTLENVVRETVCLSDIVHGYGAFRTARHRLVTAILGPRGAYLPAATTLEQAPVDRGRLLEMLAVAVLPRAGASSAARRDRAVTRAGAWSRRAVIGADRVVEGASPCRCRACSDVFARVLRIDGDLHVFAGNILGTPGGAFDESLAMLRCAGDLLDRAGVGTRDVVRVWFYLRDVEIDYDGFNDACCRFFEEEGTSFLPAITVIGGRPFPPDHRVSMAVEAVRAGSLGPPRPIGPPAPGVAAEHRSCLARGVRAVDSNKTALLISSAPGVGPRGATGGAADLRGQAERMLSEVAALLESEHAGFRDVVSAVTYLRRAADAPHLRDIYRRWRLQGFPHAVVAAPSRWPDRLCEIEAVAVLPRRSP